MRVVMAHFGARVQGRTQVFVPFQYHSGRPRSQLNHPLVARHRRTNQIIKIDSVKAKRVHDHGGHRGFAMGAGHYQSLLIRRHLAHQFRERTNANPQFQGPLQFGIVRLGVHSQDHGIQIRGNSGGIPPHRLREQARRGQSTAGRLVNAIVRTTDQIPGGLQVQG